MSHCSVSPYSCENSRAGKVTDWSTHIDRLLNQSQSSFCLFSFCEQGVTTVSAKVQYKPKFALEAVNWFKNRVEIVLALCYRGSCHTFFQGNQARNFKSFSSWFEITRSISTPWMVLHSVLFSLLRASFRMISLFWLFELLYGNLTQICLPQLLLGISHPEVWAHLLQVANLQNLQVQFITALRLWIISDF